MSRSRNIKPGFFKNDLLAECTPLARLLFAGLWCEADREGRLEDRPKRLKAEYLAYDDCDVDTLLSELSSRGFVTRYSVAESRYLAIPKFAKHQMPHHKEVPSTIPPPPGAPAITRHSYDVSPERRLAIFARDGNKCLACGSTEALSLDHIIPLAKGGGNEDENLQTLCKRCNSSKGDTTKSYVGQTLNQRKADVEAPCPSDSSFLIPDSLNLIPDSKEKKTPSQAPAFELPAWIDGEVWAAYLEARAKRRAPNTARAFGMVLRKLAKLRDEGDDPNASLEQSARSGWSDVYPVRADVRAPTNANVVPSGQRAAGLLKLEGMKSANHNPRLDYRSDAEVDLLRLGGPAGERGD